MDINTRCIAIIAHVDHGKTTLVDQLLRQSGNQFTGERFMDSNDLEKERGVTIFSKNVCIHWKGFRIHLVDTPGHADFGGEVERILSVVDAVLLLVDAVEGVMPQTRFVTQKALQKNCLPIVVVNKIDREGRQIEEAINQVYELFLDLGATDAQMDFPIIYASAVKGFATLDPEVLTTDMSCLFELMIKHTPTPKYDDKPLQMQIFSLDYSSYLGMIGLVKIYHGSITATDELYLIRGTERKRATITKIFEYVGIEKKEIRTAHKGDIIAIIGMEDLRISDTICAKDCVEALPEILVDPPTLSICFHVNDGPLAGKGKYLTSIALIARLKEELKTNVSLQVLDLGMQTFQVSGRGELHLSTLIETMRREGYELCISKPKVVTHVKDGVSYEPCEHLVLNIDEAYQGEVIQQLGMRKASLINMEVKNGRTYLEYHITTQMLIGLRREIVSSTAGTAIMHHSFVGYSPLKNNRFVRENGVLISNQAGKASGFALFNLQSRGKLTIGPKVEVYEGMIVGVHNRQNDLVVNVVKGKQLTNMRASGSDEHIVLSPVKPLTLEEALTFIEEDELVEITGEFIRLRKKHLKENERKRKG